MLDPRLQELAALLADAELVGEEPAAGWWRIDLERVREWRQVFGADPIIKAEVDRLLAGGEWPEDRAARVREQVAALREKATEQSALADALEELLALGIAV